MRWRPRDKLLECHDECRDKCVSLDLRGEADFQKCYAGCARECDKKYGAE